MAVIKTKELCILVCALCGRMQGWYYRDEPSPGECIECGSCRWYLVREQEEVWREINDEDCLS